MPGKGNWQVRVTERADGPATKLRAALNRRSEPPAKGACPIKGNISATSKIYHVPGGAFYDKVTPEQCFKTEAEAKADNDTKQWLASCQAVLSTSTSASNTRPTPVR